MFLQLFRFPFSFFAPRFQFPSPVFIVLVVGLLQRIFFLVAKGVFLVETWLFAGLFPVYTLRGCLPGWDLVCFRLFSGYTWFFFLVANAFFLVGTWFGSGLVPVTTVPSWLELGLILVCFRYHSAFLVGTWFLSGVVPVAGVAVFFFPVSWCCGVFLPGFLVLRCFSSRFLFVNSCVGMCGGWFRFDCVDVFPARAFSMRFLPDPFAMWISFVGFRLQWRATRLIRHTLW